MSDKCRAKTYLLGHLIDITTRTIIHHCVCEHEIHVPLKFQRISYDTIFHSCLDGFQVHGTFDDLVVVRSLGAFDWIVENIAIAVLRYLAMEHADHSLKAFVWKCRNYMCM